jgi:hypothetical protein
LSLYIATVLVSCVQAAIFGLFEQKKYTPLVMFKVPKGTLEESDEMEKIVKGVEKELGVKVQRLDILRDRFARNLYEKIDEIEFKGKVPLLYHRESLQSIYGLGSKSTVIAWAKGRLNPKMSGVTDGRGIGSDDFFGGDEEQEEFMEQELTELQQSGRDKMLERLENEGEEE